MNNTFENETKEKKLLSASLIEHFKLALDWIFVYLYILKALNLFSYTVYLFVGLFWTRLKKYFFISFTNKYPFEYAPYAHSSTILKHTFKYRR